MCVSLSLFLSYWQEGVIRYLISFPLLIFVCMLVKYNLRYYKILVYIVCYKHFTARKIKEANYHVYLTWSTPWIYSVTSHFGILKALRIPSTFWAFRKNLGNTKPSILPLSTTGPGSTEQRLDSLLRHLGLLLSTLHSVSCVLLVPAFWPACWVGLSNSTWRSWPTNTWATQRSNTVWTSWSTWHVSMVARDTANSVDLLGMECDVRIRRKGTCCSYWYFSHGVCICASGWIP